MRCSLRAVSGGWRRLCLYLLLLTGVAVATAEAQRPRIREPRGAKVEINGKPATKRFKFGGLYLFSPAEPEEGEDELEPPLPPSQFNPDPGVIQEDGVMAPPDLFPPVLPELLQYGEESVPRSLGLPRKGVREVRPYRKKLPYPDYEGIESDMGTPQGAQAVPNRWFVGFGRWQRYADPTAETPYQTGGDLKIWHPYIQSLLKGDAPIFRQDIFLNLTLTDFAQFEVRKLPVPSGVSALRPNSSEFFGTGDQVFFSNDFQFAIDIFKGETAFKPVDWAVRILHVYNRNSIWVEEANLLDPDPRGPERDRTARHKEFHALQEAFYEYHIRDLTDTYDFISSRFGIQPFVSDFRGFIFNDSNLGIRLFGNLDNNRWQWNAAFFDMREKDTYSDLNDFNARDQRVFIANVYRQDLIWKGYTGQVSFHASFDEASRHYDKNEALVRPAPLGDVRDHYVQSYYLGWAGDGHIGRLNISHQFYQVFGEDSYNGLAGHQVQISAQMAALELSIDKDWLRFKLTGFYASGDDNPTNSHATGFDTILDRPFLLGGPFSYYVHQGFNLGGTAVNFKQRDSLVIDFRSSKTEGQANFVNPGAIVAGYGMDIEVTPKLKAFVNANYIWTATTEPTKRALFTNHASHEIGFDASFGMQLRPWLTDNVIFTAGVGFLVPGAGFQDIYRANTRPVPGFPQRETGRVDDFLYSALVTMTLTF
jgi:hypothetical protein